MLIGWLCPYVHDKTIVVGCVISVDDLIYGKTEWVPVVLPETNIGEAIKRGPEWVLSMMAVSFFAFPNEHAAMGFLFATFEGFMQGKLSIDRTMRLVDQYGGDARDLRDYGVLYEGPPPNLN